MEASLVKEAVKGTGAALGGRTDTPPEASKADKVVLVLLWEPDVYRQRACEKCLAQNFTHLGDL